MSSFSTIVGVLTAGAVAVGGGAVAMSAIGAEDGPDHAQVVKVVDGDTLDVRFDGNEHRVRLLNVDTPETKDPNKAVECLGPEATAYLEEQLRPGDTVRLEFDEERRDRYDRVLAGVFEDDLLVNAEIARRGLGVPVVFEPNRLFYDEVVEAYEEGKDRKVGVFDPAVSCTFASRVAEYSDRVAEADAEPSLEAVQQAAEDAADEGDALLVLIDDAKPGTLAAAGMTARELGVLRDRVTRLQREATATAKDASAEIRAEAKARAQRKAAAKAKKEAAEQKAEAQRQAEAERQAEAQRQADQAAAEEARRREQQAPPAPAPAPAPQPTQEAPPAPAPARPGAGYTGCRAYVGGPYIDDQGRSYTPIDCETKLPLVP